MRVSPKFGVPSFGGGGGGGVPIMRIIVLCLGLRRAVNAQKCVLAQALRDWPAWHEQHFGTCRGLKTAAATTHGVNPSARMADADAEGIKTFVFVVCLIKSINAGTIITSVFLVRLIKQPCRNHNNIRVRRTFH